MFLEIVRTRGDLFLRGCGGICGNIPDRADYGKRRVLIVGYSIATVLAAGACLTLGGERQAGQVKSSARGEGKENPAVLYFFFTPEGGDAPEAARRAKA